MINDWSINQKNPNELIYGIDDIRQCHENILFTIPGTRPFDYEFGSTLWKYIDAPVNASFAKAAFEIKQALNKFETRSVVNKVTRTIDGSTNLLNIEGIYTATGESFITKIDLNKVYSFDATYLNISNQSLSFIAAGESIQVTVTANKGWTLISKPAWITASVSSGNQGSTTLTLTASENNADIRNGSISLKTADNAVTSVISASQAKKVYTFGRLYNWYAASSRSYGMLYNWYAATDARNIAPVGWHVPTKAEYDTLIAHLGGSSVAGGKLKETGTTYWNSPNTGATNQVGFNSLGSGYRYPEGSGETKISAYFLTTTLNTTTCSYLKLLNTDSTATTYNNSQLTRGMAIRLIKDDTTDTGAMTGNDGKQYPTVTIGTQVWLAQNLEETKFRNNETIPIVTDGTEWANLTTAGSCWYNNIRTYDFAPVGYHVPNEIEWNTLVNDIGGSSFGGTIRETGTEHWDDATGATNEFLFTALGSGFRDNNFSSQKVSTYLQSTQQSSGNNTQFTITTYNNAASYPRPKYLGCSVRFVRNINSVLETKPVDAEGNEYETVLINFQTWTKQNHKSKKWRTGENINVQETYTDVEWNALTIPACCAFNNDEGNI